jgi:hypothetical protein
LTLPFKAGNLPNARESSASNNPNLMTGTEAINYLTRDKRGRLALLNLECFFNQHEEHGLNDDQQAAAVELTRRFFLSSPKAVLEIIREGLEKGAK